MKLGPYQGGTFLTATSEPVESQGTVEVPFQLADVHGGKVTVINHVRVASCAPSDLECECLMDKGVAVVIGNELGNKICKREIHLHTSSGVYHVRATSLSELCLLEDQDPRNDVGPSAEVVREAAAPRTRRPPYRPLMKRAWHTWSATYHAEFGVITARKGWRVPGLTAMTTDHHQTYPWLRWTSVLRTLNPMMTC